MPHIITSPPNAIVFVLDPHNPGIVIPEYTKGSLVAANHTCVSVGTQADVDGPTDIHLHHGAAERGSLIEVFSGTIQSPTGTIAIFSALYEKILEIEADPGLVAVCVLADDTRSPAHICIYVNSVQQ